MANVLCCRFTIFDIAHICHLLLNPDFGRDSSKVAVIGVVLLNDQFMSVVIDVDICSVDSNFVSEECSHLLKWNLFRFDDVYPGPNDSNARENDENQIEFPSDGSKGLRR